MVIDRLRRFAAVDCPRSLDAYIWSEKAILRLVIFRNNKLVGRILSETDSQNETSRNTGRRVTS